eukprot:CAMPEP_0172181344 /NCGR_PEP_ID=MMETSP1050-20130122/17762_1 /TAXON_ID=233186 /ORGANISM="Cryptomonas curvata, Strain CCAP979/52" /LENGTH=86 /DNA_ID=CAMNT_0012854609 /DNA_START=61 /DNA_END=317 /DNA_ORIENTATION=+
MFGLSRQVDKLVRVVEDDLLRRHLAAGLLRAAEILPEHGAHLGLAQAVHLGVEFRVGALEAAVGDAQVPVNILQDLDVLLPLQRPL